MAVRMDKWKAVKLNINKVPQGETELYDLSVDPGETNNVAASNKEIVLKMEALMKEAHTPSTDFPLAFEKAK